MPYYHVYVQSEGKGLKRKQNLVMDLSINRLRKQVVEPFLKNACILVIARPIKPDKITQLKIIETKEKALILLKRADNKTILGKSIFENVLDKVDFLIDQGEDVTRNFVTNKSNNFHIKLSPKEEVNGKIGVFIAHGRDLAAVHELKRILGESGFNPIILQDQPSRGRTITERILNYSDARYAFVILTPDDYALISSDSIKPINRNQPRQNVIFEFGLLVGILGSRKVCCLLKEGTEFPADIHGLSYIIFRNSVLEIRPKIINELKAIGTAFDIQNKRKEAF
jgi:predicted nucleotide-binding protein